MADVQYGRKLRLIVSTESGDGLDLSEFRIVFDVKLSDDETPNTCRVRVYNLSGDTVSKVQKEFTVITLQAGYKNDFGTIFIGNIRQVVYGSENNTDTFIDVIAGDGDSAYNNGIVNKTLSAGSKPEDVVNASLESYQSANVGVGFVDDVDTQPLPRAKVLYGMSRHYLRNAAQNTDTTWSIQNNQYQSVKLTGLLPGQAVVLNSQTGLLYTPNQTNNGIVVKCLLNPNLKVAGQVQINQNDIQREVIDSQTSTGDSEQQSPSPISADGFYRILIAEHSGDTRGNDFITELTCLSVDATDQAGNQVDKNG